MKIAIDCKSILMRKSLELFLTKHLATAKNADIIIKDTKCSDDERCFCISAGKDADLVKPFTKAQLILALERKLKNVPQTKKVKKKEQVEKEQMDFSVLEKRIELLTQEYKNNILKTVRAFYEN